MKTVSIEALLCILFRIKSLMSEDKKKEMLQGEDIFWTLNVKV